MEQTISERVADFLKPIINDLGYNLVEVDYSKQSNGMNLTITIDSENGITLDDCVKVHRAIDIPLDNLNPTNDKPYTLNVSSPGLDRPIRTTAELAKNIGEKVEVNLFTKVDGVKNFVGVLTAFDEQNLTLTTNKGEHNFNRKNISKISKYIEI